MKDKWRVGPKFNEYLNLNFHMVAGYYVFMVVLSLVTLGMFAYLLLIPALTKICSTTLYHKQACLYQSVPVSSFETILAKSLVGTLGFLIPGVMSIGVDLVLSLVSEQRFEFYEQLKGDGMLLHAETGVVLYMLSLLATGFLLCGIALFGVAVGNRMRENRDKRPNAATAVLVIVGLCLLVYGVYWVMNQIHFSSPMLREVISLLLRTVGAGALFWINVRAMDKWYSI